MTDRHEAIDMQTINRMLNSARAERSRAIRMFFSRTRPSGSKTG